MFFHKPLFVNLKLQTKIAAFLGICIFSGSCSFQKSLLTKVESQNLPALEVPKIYKGEDFFAKHEIFRFEKTKEEKAIPFATVLPKEGEKTPKIDKDEFELNDITQIFAGEVDDESGTDILVAGRKKAFILDDEGKIKKEINYNLGTYRGNDLTQEYDFPFVSIVDLNNDGKVEIAGHGINICQIIDLNGKVVWKYKNVGKGKESHEVDYLKVADVNNDGENEVIVSKNKSFEILNLDGTVRFEKKLPNWLDGNKLEITDFNNDGKKTIFIGKTLFDGNSEVVEKLDKLYFVDVFNEKNKATALLKFENNKLQFMNSEGRVIKNLDSPLSSLKRKPRYSGGYVLYKLKTEQLKLQQNEADYLAVLVSADDEEEYNGFKILYIYNPQGELVYQETIQALNSEISILPNNDGTESLLVTDDGKLNLYKMK